MAAVHMNHEEFKAMLHSDKLLLVDYWAPWCGYCRRIGPAYEKIGQIYGDEMVVAKINIDDNAALAQQEKIEVIPTLVLYRQGKALGSIVAPESKASIENFIRQTLAK